MHRFEDFRIAFNALRAEGWSSCDPRRVRDAWRLFAQDGRFLTIGGRAFTAPVILKRHPVDV